MTEQISWDPSLVKKFSSSNHYKLLNQLRNEVKKYPLNKKKNLSSNLIKENKCDSKNILNTANQQDTSHSKNFHINNDILTNQTTVSFNNSKNFSIYNNNNNNNDSTIEQKERTISDQQILNVDSASSTFKDRLDQIDMK